MAHVGLDYLDRLPARTVPAYAIAAMERDANDLLRWVMLFQIPIEAFGGGKRPLFDHLRREAMHRLGQTKSQDDEIMQRRQRREAELVRQLATLVDAGDEEGAAELERRYAAECAAMDAEEIAAIKASNTIAGDDATIKALKRFLSPGA